MLVASYAGGALAAGLAGGVTATRLGARRAVLVGLALMAFASVGFAFASGFWSLFAARLLQGTASGFTWAGAFAWLLAVVPRERRGQMIGTAMGSATFGAMFGPVVGAAAALAGRDVVFTAFAGSSSSSASGRCGSTTPRRSSRRSRRSSVRCATQRSSAASG